MILMDIIQKPHMIVLLTIGSLSNGVGNVQQIDTVGGCRIIKFFN
jgi:hypothetical protein